MSVDSNDVKIVVNSSFHLAMSSSIICINLSLLILFYIYFPKWFDILFYTSPLIICTSIFLQRLRFGRQNTRAVKPDDEIIDKATTETTTTTMSSPRDSSTLRKKLRPAIQAAMSRRTFKKRTCEETGKIVVNDLKVDFIHRSLSDEMPAKQEVKPDAVEVKKDDEPRQEEEEEKKKKSVMEWTEEDKRNHMDLVSSDVEWNQRLENLIASRRARKFFSMLPQRNRNPIDSIVGNDLQGHVPPILIERDGNDNEGGQPGSAPSVSLPKNPFDIPYDPSEEKPILTGDGFEDEFMAPQPKDLQFCKHKSFSYGHPYKSGSSVFSDPLASVGPGLPRFGRQSDARESKKLDFEQLTQEAKLKNAQRDRQEEASTSAEKEEKDADNILLESGDAIEEQELDNEEEGEQRQNTLGMESSASARHEPEVDPDLIEDDNDDRSSSSSEEEATANVANAVKNESFRDSVKKVMLLQKNRGVPPLYPPPSSDTLDDSTLKSSRPTKMEERSLYTRPTHHLSYSIASDMQVEVSEASSPPCMLNDGPNSPIDGESLDFDRDEDDSDLDLLGASTDPDRSEESTTSREHPESSKQNLTSSQDANSDSTKSEEQMIFSPRESSISGEFKQTNKAADVQSEDQENAPMVGSASTNTEQNIDTYIHLPSHELLSEDQENVYQESGDAIPQRSLQTSVSQPLELELVPEPEVIDLTPSPRCVLQATVSMDDGALINSELNIIGDTQPPADTIGSSSSPKSVLPNIIEHHRDEVENSSLSDAPQEDHQPDTPDEDSVSSRREVNTVSPLSSTSPSPQSVPLDEMAIRSSESVHSNIQPFDGVLVSKIPLQDLPLPEDQVSQDGSTSVGNDASEEKTLQEAVLEPRVSEDVQDQDKDQTKDH